MSYLWTQKYFQLRLLLGGNRLLLLLKGFFSFANSWCICSSWCDHEIIHVRMLYKYSWYRGPWFRSITGLPKFKIFKIVRIILFQTQTKIELINKLYYLSKLGSDSWWTSSHLFANYLINLFFSYIYKHYYTTTKIIHLR